MFISLYKMITPKRAHNKWTVTELNTLQREYELLELTVQEIADRHQRSVYAILYKLESEGIINSGWSNARGFLPYSATDDENEIVKPSAKYDDDSSYSIEDCEGEEYDEDDEENVLSNLTTRMDTLEDKIEAIHKALVPLLHRNFDTMMVTRTSVKKRQPLRRTISEMS